MAKTLISDSIWDPKIFSIDFTSTQFKGKLMNQT